MPHSLSRASGTWAVWVVWRRSGGAGQGPYLEDSEDGGREGVEVGRRRLILKVEPEKYTSLGKRQPHREPGAPSPLAPALATGGMQAVLCVDRQGGGRRRPQWYSCSKLASCPPQGHELPPERLPFPLGATYCPPNSCMPSKAKTTMNRKSRNRRLTMDFMELSSDTTRFRKELQYLPGAARTGVCGDTVIGPQRSTSMRTSHTAASTLTPQPGEQCEWAASLA